MELKDDKESNDNSRKPMGISAIVFSIFAFAVVGYSLFISDSTCIRYLGRRGIQEDCSAEKLSGFFAVGGTAMIGLIFLVVGIRNILARSNNK